MDAQSSSDVQIGTEGELPVRPQAHRDAWAAYERFLADSDLSEMDGAMFDDLRDRSPGRDVKV